MAKKDQNPTKEMTVLDHITELRNRFLVSLLSFVVCAIVALVFYEKLISLFIVQFDSIESGLGTTLFTHSIVEGFLVQLKTAAISASSFRFPSM